MKGLRYIGFGLALIGMPFALGLAVERVSVDSSENEAAPVTSIPGESSEVGAVSADGRFVVFSSISPNLVPNDTNVCDVPDLIGPGTCSDVFVRDRLLGTTERVSVDSLGEQATTLPSDSSGSFNATMTADGRYVAFASFARDLVPSDTNEESDVFLHDRNAHSTQRVSLGAAGGEANGFSQLPQLSDDAAVIGFLSRATNLVSTPVSGTVSQLYVRESGSTELVSTGLGGQAANADVGEFSISGDGRFLAFESSASNLVPGVAFRAIYVRDRQSGSAELVSVSSGGVPANGECHTSFASMSADGRYVAFTCGATDIDSEHAAGVFVRDRHSAVTERVATFSTTAAVRLAMSGDGRFVAFNTLEALVPEDTNGLSDVYLHDRGNDSTVRISVAADGTQGNGSSEIPELSFTGRFVILVSQADNFVPNDTNGVFDAFLIDRLSSPAVAIPLVGSPFGLAGALLIISLASLMLMVGRRGQPRGAAKPFPRLR